MLLVDEVVVEVELDGLVDVDVVGAAVVVVVPVGASGSVSVKNNWSAVTAALFDDTRT